MTASSPTPVTPATPRTPRSKGMLRLAALFVVLAMFGAACSNQSPTTGPDQGASGGDAETEVLGSTQGNTYYVSAEFGNDGNSGTSQDSPLRFITTAVSRLQAGDTVFVMNGTYTGDNNNGQAHIAVSYTHLTLPTTPYV